jgi:hypothetical protein
MVANVILSAVDIAALILWAFTAGVGVYLLWAVNAAKRALAAPPPDVRIVRAARQPASATAGAVTSRPGETAVQAAGTQAAGTAAPHITHTRVTAGPGDHPLLEFAHPALGLIGLGSWLAFTFIHYHGFGWFAFGVLCAGIGAGLAWLTGNARAARQRRLDGGGQDTGSSRLSLPRHVIVLHGAAAATTLTLAAITMLVITAHV